MKETFQAYRPDGEVTESVIRRPTQRPGLQRAEREDFCVAEGVIVPPHSVAASCIMAAYQGAMNCSTLCWLLVAVLLLLALGVTCSQLYPQSLPDGVRYEFPPNPETVG